MKQNFEWISVNDRLPEESGEYLVRGDRNYYNVINYSARYKLLNCFDSAETREEAERYASHNVKAWAEIPPYKEEEKDV